MLRDIMMSFVSPDVGEIVVIQAIFTDQTKSFDN